MPHLNMQYGFFETLQTGNKIQHLNITIVSPGRIYTPISLNALKGDRTTYGKMDKEQVKGIAVAVCTRKILQAISKKKKHIIMHRMKFFYGGYGGLPGPYYRMA